MKLWRLCRMENEVDIVALDELLIDFTEDGDRTWP